jgi:hypothetical protein
MKVKPIDPNAVIRDPVTLQPLPAKGGEVPDNVHWNRRLIADMEVRLPHAGRARPAREGREGAELAAKKAAELAAKPATSADPVAEKK